MTIRAVDGLHRVAVDGRWLVFDPTRHRAHLLNPSAALVLDLLDGQRDLDAVVVACADAASAAPAVVAADVATAIDHLVDEGLASSTGSAASAGSAGATGSTARPARTGAVVGPPLTTGDAVELGPAGHRTRRFRGIETVFDVTADDAALVARLDRLLAALGDASRVGPDEVVHRYEVVDDGRFATIALDGELVARVPVGTRTVEHLLWHIDRLVFETTTRHLLLHAGAVVAADGIVVLAGVMNSGKSTLTAALVRSGLDFVTDEVVAVGLDDGLVTPFPRPITLEAGSWPLFASDVAAAAEDEPRASRRYVTLAGPPPGRRQRVTHIVFPCFVAGAAIEVTPVAPAEVALELTRHTFTLDGPGVDAIADLAQRVPAVRLRHPGIEVAVPVVQQWLVDAPAPSISS